MKAALCQTQGLLFLLLPFYVFLSPMVPPHRERFKIGRVGLFNLSTPQPFNHFVYFAADTFKVAEMPKQCVKMRMKKYSQATVMHFSARHFHYLFGYAHIRQASVMLHSVGNICTRSN